MKGYASIFIGIVVVLLLLFALTATLDIDIFNDPEPWMRERSGEVAFVGVGLLLADVLFPVPSSFVMTAHGRLFGPVLGTLLSLAGSIGLTMLSYSIGRAGGRRMTRVVPEAERDRAERVLGRWGVGLIIMTRPLPLLAESVAVMAGASKMPAWKVLLAVSVTTALSWIAGYEGGIVGALPAGLPTFAIPQLDFTVIPKLAVGAAVMTLIGLVETAAIPKTIATTFG